MVPPSTFPPHYHGGLSSESCFLDIWGDQDSPRWPHIAPLSTVPPWFMASHQSALRITGTCPALEFFQQEVTSSCRNQGDLALALIQSLLPLPLLSAPCPGATPTWPCMCEAARSPGLWPLGTVTRLDAAWEHSSLRPGRSALLEGIGPLCKGWRRPQSPHLPFICSIT